jgi:hypothetical protein
MLIETILSATVTVVFGVMIVLEWTATEISSEKRSRETPHFLQRADTLLVLCIVLCNAIIWVPALFR